MNARCATLRTILRLLGDNGWCGLLEYYITSSPYQCPHLEYCVAVEEQSAKAELESLRIAIDRDAEVPIGVQIAWTIRARIGDGTLTPGQRLPGLRELAEATGVNFNTVRAVYQRLENDGLIDSQQGTGTFVASTAKPASTLGDIAASAAREAHARGIDPRDVAAALYSSPDALASPDSGTERRRLLRMQITALELAIAEIEAEHPGAAPSDKRTRRGAGPRLLSAEELDRVRVYLVQRLAALRTTIDEQAATNDDSPPPAEKQEFNVVGDVALPELPVSPKPKRRPRPATRPAPASS
jgi:DNA-binding transcriptional regulator YhcF (GntR family)